MNLAKPAILWLTTDPDAVVSKKVDDIVNALTNNAAYPDPGPSLAAVKSANAAFAAAMASAAGGGVALTSAKNDARAALVVLLRELASYVQTACKGDLTVLLTSGFPVQKTNRQPVGQLPAPVTPLVTLGVASGTLRLRSKPVLGASVYSWQMSTSATPTEWQDMGQTTGSSNDFDGLTPGVIYNFQLNAVGAAGPSDWSNTASQMAL